MVLKKSIKAFLQTVATILGFIGVLFSIGCIVDRLGEVWLFAFLLFLIAFISVFTIFYGFEDN